MKANLYSGHVPDTLEKLDVELDGDALKITITPNGPKAKPFTVDSLEEAVRIFQPNRPVHERLSYLKTLIDLIETRARKVAKDRSSPDLTSKAPGPSKVPIGVPITRKNVKNLPPNLSAESRARIFADLGIKDPEKGSA